MIKNSTATVTITQLTKRKTWALKDAILSWKWSNIESTINDIVCGIKIWRTLKIEQQMWSLLFWDHKMTDGAKLQV